MATFCLLIQKNTVEGVPAGAPTWNRANIATNSGWTVGAGGTIAYHDADADPGTGATYVFTPDASGLSASTPYDLWAVWDDGATTVGPVQGTTFETLGATSSVSSDFAGTYTIRGAASSDLSGTFTVRAAVSSDLPGTFTVRSAISSELEGSWAVRSAVSSDLSGGYEVLSANTVSSDLSGAYAVRGSVSSDLSGEYAVRSSVSADRSGAFSVRSEVSQDLSGGWTVRGAVSSDCTGSYLLRGSVSGDLSGSYQVGDGYSISPSQAALLYNLYRLHGLAEPLTVSPSSREVASLQQQVTSLGGATTIETISLPAEAPLDPGLLIEELAALHGLTTPLTVTSEGRTAGAIAQSFSLAGNLTVVTRQ